MHGQQNVKIFLVCFHYFAGHFALRQEHFFATKIKGIGEDCSLPVRATCKWKILSKHSRIPWLSMEAIKNFVII